MTAAGEECDGAAAARRSRAAVVIRAPGRPRNPRRTGNTTLSSWRRCEKKRRRDGFFARTGAERFSCSNVRSLRGRRTRAARCPAERFFFRRAHPPSFFFAVPSDEKSYDGGKTAIIFSFRRGFFRLTLAPGRKTIFFPPRGKS